MTRDSEQLEHRFTGSTRVHHAWRDPDAGTITVEFLDGVRWQYRNCSDADWTDFIHAGSPGRYIATILDHRPSGPA